jgi:hypothetical protein
MVVSVNISLKFIESRNNTVNNFYGWNSTLPQNDIAKKLQEVNPQKKAASVTSKTPSAILSNENFNKRQTEIQQKIDKDNPFNKFLNKGRGSLLGGAGL